MHPREGRSIKVLLAGCRRRFHCCERNTSVTTMKAKRCKYEHADSFAIGDSRPKKKLLLHVTPKRLQHHTIRVIRDTLSVPKQLVSWPVCLSIQSKEKAIKVLSWISSVDSWTLNHFEISASLGNEDCKVSVYISFHVFK